jgi:FkbM family methyltransferase
MAYGLRTKGGFFVDVGVNIGQTLVKYIKLHCGNGYIGFDPNPDAVVFAERIVELNHVPNAYLIPAGLDQKAGAGKLWIKSNYGPAATIIENFRGDDKSHDRVKGVALLNGDKVFKDLGIDSVSLIKIDVEGSELNVLAGLRETIAGSRPFIVVEVLPIHDIAIPRNAIRKEKSDAVVQFMKEINYQMYRVLDAAVLKLVHINHIEIHSDLTLCNYFCVPDELNEDMRARLQSEGVRIEGS